MRQLDWLARMRAELDAAADRPFEYGVHDCCMFAARIADAISTTQYVAALQLMYTDEASASALIEQTGGLAALVEQVTGFAPKPVAQANRGDMVLIGIANGDAMGICVGTQIAAASQYGWTTRPIGLGRLAWSV